MVNWSMRHAMLATLLSQLVRSRTKQPHEFDCGKHFSCIEVAIGTIVAALLLVTITLPVHAQSQIERTNDSTTTSSSVEPVANENPIFTRNLLQVIQEGGVLLVPIGICSFILTMFIFERAVSLRHGRVIPRPFIRRFLEQLHEGKLTPEEAIARCEENRSPVAEIFAAAVRKWGRSSVEVEQAIIDTGERVSNGLRRHLRLFNGISTISPLLGLLGTVVGMIRAFDAIATADAMGRPELLAAGISQALLTTAAGLSVAIPALIAYLFFVGRVDRLIIEMDSLGQDIVNHIAADAWKSKSTTPSKKRKGQAA